MQQASRGQMGRNVDILNREFAADQSIRRE
jgi:hypothetical protein